MSRHPPQIAARATMRRKRARAAAENSSDVVELPYEIWERIIARIIRSEEFGSYVQYDKTRRYRVKVRGLHEIVWEELESRMGKQEAEVQNYEASTTKLANVIMAKRCGKTISALRGTCQTFRRVMDGPIGRDVCREAWETVIKCCLDAFLPIQLPNSRPRTSRRTMMSVYRSREAPSTMSHENKLALFFGETCQMCGEDVRKKNTVVYRGVQWRVGARVCDECLRVNLMAPPKRGSLIDGQPILEEHYKSLPKIKFTTSKSKFVWYWRNSVLKNMERTKERQRRLEEKKKKKKRKAVANETQTQTRRVAIYSRREAR